MKLVKFIELPYHKESNGDLVVAEGENNVIPFSIKRVFNVRATEREYSWKTCSSSLFSVTNMY